MTSKIKLASITARFPFILFYEGDFTESPTVNIINIVEENFAHTMHKGLLKRFIYLIIESLQNIERYSAHASSSKDFSLIFSDGHSLYIITQNLIHNEKVEDLKNRLEEISSKNEAELTDIYKSRLVNESKTEKGAGLGLIEIARKSKNKLLYCFEDNSPDFTLYTLGIALEFENKLDVSPINNDEIKKIIGLLKENFIENKSTLLYGGDVSTKFIKSLLAMLVGLKNDKNSLNKKTHHILIEFIQNIKKHSYKEITPALGQLFLEWTNDNLEISTYNLVNQKNANYIEQKLNDLENADKSKLMQFSKDQLTDFTAINGLGLIDVSVLTYPEKIKHQLIKQNEQVSELLLSAKIQYE